MDKGKKKKNGKKEKPPRLMTLRLGIGMETTYICVFDKLHCVFDKLQRSLYYNSQGW